MNPGTVHDGTLGPGIAYWDLDFLHVPDAQATAIIRAPGSVALVDPGASTCLERLEAGLHRQGLALRDLTEILLTHVHLDHAGATGTILRQHPHIRVYVHERGARHLIDPAKLIDSASRFFGAANMAAYWGEIAPVKEDRLHILHGGEQIEAGGRTFEVAYTPGHAVHHVSYFDPSSRVAFVGDSGGQRVRGGYILPPTPPPDIDLEAWTESVRRMLAWQPRSVFVAHSGPFDDVEAHMRGLLANLEWMAELVRASLSESGTDDEKSRGFGETLRSRIRSAVTHPNDVTAYEPTVPLESLWLGLARYWRKKAAAPHADARLPGVS